MCLNNVHDWCSNNISIQMASMSIPYELMKSRFHIILIAKLWSILLVNALVFHRWNPLSYVMTIKVVYLYHKTQYFMLATISRFIIIWCKNILNFYLLSWCITTQKIWLQIQTKEFFANKHEYFQHLMGMVRCIT